MEKEPLDPVNALEAMIDRANKVLDEWIGAFGGDLEEVENEAGHTVAEILGEFQTALSLPEHLQDELTDAEKSLPLIVQIMQAQYAAMANTMNRQVALAKEERAEIARVLINLSDALDAHMERLSGVGLALDNEDLAGALAAAHAEIHAARRLLGEESS